MILLEQKNGNIQKKEKPSNHLVLVFCRLMTRISSAPHATNSSMTVAIRFDSTIALTATQSVFSSAVMVGAVLPGVILVAVSRSVRATLYWQRTYFWAAAAERWSSQYVRLVAESLVAGGRVSLKKHGKGDNLTDNTSDAGGNKVDKFLVGVMFGFDQNGSAFEDGVDGLETC